jgi:hypothetical protein
MAAHVVSLRKRWYARRFTPQLTHVFQNDFGVAAVFLDKAVDLDVLALELANVPTSRRSLRKTTTLNPQAFSASQKLSVKCPAGSGLTLRTLPATQPSDPIFSAACTMERHFAEQSEERTREIAIRRSIG